MTQGRASCLCGKIKLLTNHRSTHLHACHCGMCRKWSGGPFMALQSSPDVEFEDADHIQIYDSSEWAQRGFCKHCGTHLFYLLKETQEYFFPVGLFDNIESVPEFVSQIYIDKKPDYYSFTNATTDLTEAEFLAMLAKEPDAE